MLFALLLAVYYAIFVLSAQDGLTSGALSGRVSTLIASLLHAESTDAVHHMIRKLAHVTEYAVLYALWYLLFLEVYPARSARAGFLLPLALSVLSAAGDELHQYFVPGRAGRLTDVLIDTGGMLFALCLLALLKAARKSRRNSR